MNPEHIEQNLEQLADAVGSRDSFVNDVMNRIENSPVQPGKKQNRNVAFRRILMKTPIKFTAAATVLIAATLSLTLFDKTVPSVYALEQTVEALNAMRSIHTRIYYPGYQDPVFVWARFHKNGSTEALRVSQSKFAPGDPHDGPKDITWKNNVAQVLLKNKNTVVDIHDQTEAAKVGMLFQELNPKLLVQKLEQMQKQGTAQIEIDQPDEIDQPIIITATLAEENLLLGHQAVILVDQATKLVLSLETLKGDGVFDLKTEHFGMYDFSRIEFFDYNQPLKDDIFSLKVPDDATMIDLATNIVGLSPGEMSIEETAVEVVKRFWESLIEQDYEVAGLMYGGVPAEKLQEAFGEQPESKILKVISVDTVKIHPNPMFKNKAFLVPCTIEYLEEGQIKQKTYNCIVKEVDGQPGQWAICGGI